MIFIALIAILQTCLYGAYAARSNCLTTPENPLFHLGTQSTGNAAQVSGIYSDQAFQFTAASSTRRDASENLTFGNTDITISFSIKFTSLNNDFQSIINTSSTSDADNYNSGANPFEIYMYQKKFKVKNTNTDCEVEPLADDETNVWIHWTFIIEQDGSVRAFKNGIFTLCKDGHYTSITPVERFERIVRFGVKRIRGINSQYLDNAIIDDFFIFERALIGTERWCLLDSCSILGSCTTCHKKSDLCESNEYTCNELNTRTLCEANPSCAYDEANSVCASSVCEGLHSNMLETLDIRVASIIPNVILSGDFAQLVMNFENQSGFLDQGCFFEPKLEVISPETGGHIDVTDSNTTVISFPLNYFGYDFHRKELQNICQRPVGSTEWYECQFRFSLNHFGRNVMSWVINMKGNYYDKLYSVQYFEKQSEDRAYQILVDSDIYYQNQMCGSNCLWNDENGDGFELRLRDDYLRGKYTVTVDQVKLIGPLPAETESIVDIGVPTNRLGKSQWRDMRADQEIGEYYYDVSATLSLTRSDLLIVGDTQGLKNRITKARITLKANALPPTPPPPADPVDPVDPDNDPSGNTGSEEGSFNFLSIIFSMTGGIIVIVVVLAVRHHMKKKQEQQVYQRRNLAQIQNDDTVNNNNVVQNQQQQEVQVQMGVNDAQWQQNNNDFNNNNFNNNMDMNNNYNNNNMMMMNMNMNNNNNMMDMNMNNNYNNMNGNMNVYPQNDMQFQQNYGGQQDFGYNNQQQGMFAEPAKPPQNPL